jgi:transcriptional regulator with XRE-family HTH domain
MRLEQAIAEWKKDPEFARAYEERAPDFEVARAVILRRRELGLTQAQLAERVGTKQASISRLENATGHPSVSFLTRVARALGVQVHITLAVPQPQMEQSQPSMAQAAHGVISLPMIVANLQPRVIWAQHEVTARDRSAPAFRVADELMMPIRCDRLEAA